MCIEETPYIAVRYCPGCEPHRDPSREILDVSWCAEHVPAHQGTEDSIVIAQQYMSGSAEAGADGDNKRMCSLIHRGINLESTHE